MSLDKLLSGQGGAREGLRGLEPVPAEALHSVRRRLGGLLSCEYDRNSPSVWCAGSAAQPWVSPAAAAACAQQLATTKAGLAKAQTSASALSTRLRSCNTQKASLSRQLRWGCWLTSWSADSLCVRYAPAAYVTHRAAVPFGLGA